MSIELHPIGTTYRTQLPMRFAKEGPASSLSRHVNTMIGVLTDSPIVFTNTNGVPFLDFSVRHKDGMGISTPEHLTDKINAAITSIQ